MSIGSSKFYRATTCIGLLIFSAVPAVFANSRDQYSAKREFNKTLPLGAGQTLAVENKFGEVRVHGENSREVKITATIRTQAGSQEKADRRADEIRIEVSQDGQGIKVRTVNPDESFVVLRIGNNTSYSVDYDISVPNDAKVWVKNAFGNADVRGVQGWTEVVNSNGNVALHDSGAAKLTNSFGSVETGNVSGKLTVINANGPVSVAGVKGDLDVKDRFASITISGVQGAALVSGGNGTVELTDVGASVVSNSFGTVTARNVHGDITINDNNGAIDVNDVNGAAELNTSFGSISFNNIAGRVKCSSSNANVHGTKAGELFVKTSFGGVTLEQISGALRVENSNGDVTVKDAKGYATLSTSFGAIEGSGLSKGVHATTGNGRIELNDVSGDAYAKTSFGTINVQHVSGSLTIENSNGAVSAEAVSGDTSAKTSFGAVKLEDIGGAVTVENQNGSVSVTARAGGSCKNVSIKTSFSPIQVRLPGGAEYNLTAHTSFGRINSELPVTSMGQISGESLNGKIGNGGCTLSLTNSNSTFGHLQVQERILGEHEPRAADSAQQPVDPGPYVVRKLGQKSHSEAGQIRGNDSYFRNRSAFVDQRHSGFEQDRIRQDGRGSRRHPLQRAGGLLPANLPPCCGRQGSRVYGGARAEHGA
jgi:DUF4097 and DUF4098 domain-containing protein YvlB